MNHDSPDPELQYMEISDRIVPTDIAAERLQVPFSVEYGPAAETPVVQDFEEELNSWIGNYNNEFSPHPYVATPPQQAENEVVYNEDSLTVTEYIRAGQLVEPVADFNLWQPDEFVQGGQLLVQPVTTPLVPPPPAEDALQLLEPPLYESVNMPPFEPGLVEVEPSGFNNNHQFFSAPPAVHNSPWAVSPFPSSSAPVYYEPAVEPMAAVAAMEEGETTAVVVAVEETKEKGSTSVVQEENQVRNIPAEN